MADQNITLSILKPIWLQIPPDMLLMSYMFQTLLLFYTIHCGWTRQPFTKVVCKTTGLGQCLKTSQLRQNLVSTFAIWETFLISFEVYRQQWLLYLPTSSLDGYQGQERIRITCGRSSTNPHLLQMLKKRVK